MAKKIDSNKFWAVKTLLDGGATHEEISRYLGISLSTIQRIKHSENMEEYLQKCAVAALKYKEKAKQKPDEQLEVKPGPKPDRPSDMELRILNALNEQTELLKLLSNKLVYIVEQLT